MSSFKRSPGNLFLFCIACISFPSAAQEPTASDVTPSASHNWQSAAESGNYDEAVLLSRRENHDNDGNIHDSSGVIQSNTGEIQDNALARLIDEAGELELSKHPQWLAFIHYKPRSADNWLSQVDSPHFFMSASGKNSPSAELNATLASFFSKTAKPPLRLSAYCRFVARRVWLESQLSEAFAVVPKQDCIEFTRYKEYLDADVLTLVFPTAHPNSPSSAFGHTLLRIDKKDQRHESRLLNMSLNFAADVPADVPSAAYAFQGLSGGFEGRFRLLPYHIKLREYGQIENRDTWEYELKLDKAAVDLILRHAYEMLISHFDYYFLSENCSYHLLSLIEVAFPETPVTEEFDFWTIPVDTIRTLEQFDLTEAPRFVPSAIRTLRARQDALSDEDRSLAIAANIKDLSSIDNELSSRTPEQQAAILDLLSDYERYERLEKDTSAQGSSNREKAILSRRSKLGIPSKKPVFDTPEFTPNDGHGTSRIGLYYHSSTEGSNIVELSFRPAYHDKKDPSAGFDDKAAIELGLVSLGFDTKQQDVFLKRFTLVSIESIEPIGTFFKPISWRSHIFWDKPDTQTTGQFTLNIGAGKARKYFNKSPVFYGFGEAELIYNAGLSDRLQLQFGASAGMHWEIVNGLRTGFETNLRHQVGGKHYTFGTEIWAGIAMTENWSLNIDLTTSKQPQEKLNNTVSIGIRSYF